MPESTAFRDDEGFALEMDERDPLRSYRDRFHLPAGAEGVPLIYFAGNSLGLEPRGVREAVLQELDDWAKLGVEGHALGRTPWYSYHEQFRDSGARLVGGRPGEVVMMNSLTVNLHLLLVSFYRPTARRHKILVEDRTFPSDAYAVETQLASRGYDPDKARIVVRPREGEERIRTEDVLGILAEHGPEIALVLLPGVHYFTGQVFDMATIAGAARRAGATVGFDLAHAAGNVPVELHDWDVDFAVWCSYKYLNGGPGAVAGAFVHTRHGARTDLPRYAGWWGNDPGTRFEMHLRTRFVAQPGAEGWQVSNPPILSMAPLGVSLGMFEEAGMERLRAKSERLASYLEQLIARIPGKRFEVITPSRPAERGCQMSILVREGAPRLFEALRAAGVVSDLRQPNVIRVAPTPLYNTFHEVWRFARVLARTAG